MTINGRLALIAVSLALLPLSLHAQSELTLQRTTATVEAFLTQLSEVKCTERVTQEKLAPNGKVEDREQSTFDYLVLMQGGSDDLLLDESRLAVKQRLQTKRLPLLITNGFSTLFLVFHPYYRESFRFTTLSPTAGNVGSSPNLYRVDFEHIRGKRTPVALAVRGREYPLELAGSAWIDGATGSVVRMEAHLASSMEDVGLRTLNTTVDYAPIKLPDLEATPYFPTRARVEVESLRQHWINTHDFTDYKRFSVTTGQTVAKP